MKHRIPSLLTLLGLIGIGCSGPTEPVAIATIQVTAPSTTLASGATVQLTAATLGKNGTALTDRVVTWSSSNQTIATVSAMGLVTAGSVLNGTAESVTVTASAEGISGSVMLSVSPEAAASVTITPVPTVLQDGQSVTVEAAVLAASGAVLPGRSITMSVSDTALASITQAGRLTAKIARRAREQNVWVHARFGSLRDSTSVTIQNHPFTAFHLIKTIRTELTGMGYQLRYGLGDFDGDGTEDVLGGGWVTNLQCRSCGDAANTPPAPLWLLRQRPTGGVEDVSATLTGSTASFNLPVVDDFNSDGRADFFLPGFFDVPPLYRPSSVGLSEPGGHVIQKNIGENIWAHSPSKGDLNGDGCTDVLPTASTTSFVLFGNCRGGFERRAVSSTAIPLDGLPELVVQLCCGWTAVAAADFNRDGSVDLFITDEPVVGATGPWRVYPQHDLVILDIDWTSNPVVVKRAYPLPPAILERSNTNEEPRSHDRHVAAVDINKDGFLDIVVSSLNNPQSDASTNRQDENWLQAYLNFGNFRFVDISEEAFPGKRNEGMSTDHLLVRDLNGDGIADIFSSSNSFTEAIPNEVWLGNGTTGFVPYLGIDFARLLRTAEDVVRTTWNEQKWSYWPNLPARLFPHAIIPVLRSDRSYDFIVTLEALSSPPCGVTCPETIMFLVYAESRTRFR